ncbi:MAG: sigma-70 family RNA polymerase sigma factor [Vicinamibacteria bacterium]
MSEADDRAAGFEQHRGHLRAVAYRMLGSRAEAEDAVQEAWLRLHRTDTADVLNLGGWLTTVVARVCLDQLRTRKARREDALEARPLPVADGTDVERDALLADAVGPALLVLLDTLDPAERLAFVLHDLFGVPFDEVAQIVDRSPAAARQLASRARRRVQGADVPAADVSVRRRIVDAFLAASREGGFGALLAVRDPDVVLRADAAAVAAGAVAEVRGASAVAETFKGRARFAQAALLDGVPGAVWAAGGQVRAAFVFRFDGERVAGIEIVMDPETIASMETTEEGGR